jgi:cytochrome c peroxidase
MRARTHAALAAVALLVLAAGTSMAGSLTPIEELGKKLFFDTNLSTPTGVACAACHGPDVGFTGPVSDLNEGGAVYPGAVHTRFGNRKPPSAAYGGSSPILYFDADDETWVGGMFWDGRASGWTLGDPLAEQAEGPFLNPLEQNNPDAKFVVTQVSMSDYAALFVQVWGPGSLDPINDVAGSYERIARSIAAYERSAEVSPFTSKYDYYLKKQVKLTKLEKDGLKLYEGKAMCAACHPSQPGPSGEPPLFTDFTYDNLGVPRNPANPFYDAPPSTNPAGANWVDPGLGGFLASTGYADQAEENWGKQKVPTLRNVDKRPYPGFVKAFAHNGYFKSLEEIVHFYNTRDVAPWPPPEVAVNVNHDELGNLGLTADEEAAVVAFLRTLSDGYVLPASSGMAAGALDREGSEGVGIRLVPSHGNPVHGALAIRFVLRNPGTVTLAIFDVNGRSVRTLPSLSFTAGEHSIAWDGRDGSGNRVATGAYFYRISSGSASRVGKVIQVR